MVRGKEEGEWGEGADSKGEEDGVVCDTLAGLLEEIDTLVALGIQRVHERAQDRCVWRLRFAPCLDATCRRVIAQNSVMLQHGLVFCTTRSISASMIL